MSSSIVLLVPEDVWTAEGLTVFCNDESGSAGFHGWDKSFWALDENDNLCICSNDDISREFWTPVSWGPFPGMKLIREIKGTIPEMHVDMAKSARFEFEG